MMYCLEKCAKTVKVYEIGDNLTCVLRFFLLFLVALAIVVAVCYCANKMCEKHKHTDRLKKAESIMRRECVYGEYEVAIRESKDESKVYSVFIKKKE